MSLPHKCANNFFSLILFNRFSYKKKIKLTDFTPFAALFLFLFFLITTNWQITLNLRAIGVHVLRRLFLNIADGQSFLLNQTTPDSSRVVFAHSCARSVTGDLSCTVNLNGTCILTLSHGHLYAPIVAGVTARRTRS